MERSKILVLIALVGAGVVLFFLLRTPNVVSEQTESVDSNAPGVPSSPADDLASADKHPQNRNQPIPSSMRNPPRRTSNPDPDAADDSVLIQVEGQTKVSAELIAAAINFPPVEEWHDIEALKGSIRAQVARFFSSIGMVKAGVEEIEIDPGPPPVIQMSLRDSEVYRYGDVSVSEEGAGLAAAADLPSMDGLVNYSELRSAFTSMQQQLADIGYLDAQVVPQLRPGADGRMDVALNVTKGARYTVGNMRVPPDFRMPLQTGDPFFLGLLRAQMAAQGIPLENLQFVPNPSTLQVDVVIQP